MFLENAEKQSAIERKLEIIGEATKRLSVEVKKKNPHIPWKEMAGMRDKIIHDYPELELKEIWRIVKKDIPALKKDLQKILNSI